MNLFLIKKTFFDFWDHLFTLVIFNLGFLLIGFVELSFFWLFFKIGVTFLVNINILLFLFVYYLFFLVCGILLFVYIGAVSRYLKEIADFKNPEPLVFFKYLKETYKASLIFTIIFITFFYAFFISSRFYLNINQQIFGLNIGVFIFLILLFFTIISSLAVQFFFPLQSHFGTDVMKNIKKMYLLCFDNTGFSIFLFIINFIIILISFVTLFIFLGLSINVLFLLVAFKLRLYKYDYLEEHPDCKARDIPWDELLADDRDKVGKRSFKGMIFPWKE